MSTEDNRVASKTLLIRTRGGHKAYLTKVMSDVKTLIAKKDPSTKVKLAASLKTLNSRKETIDGLDNEILALLTEDEIEKEIIQSGDYSMSIDETVLEIIDVLDQMDESSTKTNRSFPFEGGEGDFKSSAASAKLPKLILKTFSGDILHFQEFWECYDSAVHSNESLDKITKYNYLRSLLVGDAAATVSGLALTSDNYDEAVSILRARYGNKQVLISTHIDNLLNLPSVGSSKDVKKLCQLYGDIENNVRSLTNLKVASSHYGPVLISIVMSKLPDDIKLVVSRFMASCSSESETEWKMDELMKVLKQEIESRELCNFVAKSTDKTDRWSKRDTGAFTAQSLVTGTKDDYNACVYCGKGHLSWKCNNVTDVESRKHMLRKQGRCFLCLRTKHVARFCSSKYRCVKCNGKHNISICGP